MAKNILQFVCQACGSSQSKWMGKCPDCGQWDTLEEFKVPSGGAAGSQLDPQRGVAEAFGQAAGARPIGEISQSEGGGVPDGARLTTCIGELDRVLGGEQTKDGRKGIVPGSAVLIGGDPGIGKSTLMLQAAYQLAKSGERVLYVTSEESAQQLTMRARRLGVRGEGQENLFVLADTNLARIVEQVSKVQPAVVVIDSIQMIYKGDLAAAPGSVSQLRACCLDLVYLAKATGCAVLLVGHVTKQGQIAGPRLLEHMVDTVLYFEGDHYHSHRVIRAIKNRYGTTLEVGLFEMTGAGLAEVKDGGGLLGAEYQAMAGSVVCPVLQGSRCLLIEIQALTVPGILGSVKRKTSGLDASRLAMLIAVLEKRGGLRLADQDIFASSVGGMKIVEPAGDLAVAMAIAGAHYNKQLGKGYAAIGEIGLGGEIRHVQQLEQRVREAARLGFADIIVPKTNVKGPKDCRLIQVEKLDQALGLLG